MQSKEPQMNNDRAPCALHQCKNLVHEDHALIGNFMGFWPTKKSLQGWIASKWKPKGHIDLQLCAKGIFNVLFTCIEDKNRIMDGGPYFFNSTALTLDGAVQPRKTIY